MPEVFSFDDVVVDFTRMQVTAAGHSVACTPQEFKILRFFAANTERAVSREELPNAAQAQPQFAEVKITVSGQCPDLRFDHRRLERAFYNLLLDACEAVREMAGSSFDRGDGWRRPHPDPRQRPRDR